MKTSILNTDRGIYLIKFSFAMTNYKFIFSTGIELKELLKSHDSRGIDYIKVFDPVKEKFVKISKEKLLSFFDWDTEAILFLKNHYFFK